VSNIVPTRGGALLRKMQDDARTIGELRTLIEQQRKRISQLEEHLNVERAARVNDAQKYRDREAALKEELRARSKGVSTGCACPAGKCMKLNGAGEMCWAQWAGLAAVRNAAQSEIDRMVQSSNHPSRYRKPDEI
jgi:hypothetical protein